MSDLIYKNYLFSSREFAVLSACVGMEKVPMIEKTQSGALSEKAVKLTFFELYQKGILTWCEDGTYRLVSEYLLLFQSMKKAEYIIQIYLGKGRSPLLCFGGTDVVVAELSENDHDILKVHALSKMEFFRELMDRNVIPERDSQKVEDWDIELKNTKLNEFVREITTVAEDVPFDNDNIERIFQKISELKFCITVNDTGLGQDQRVLFLIDCGIFDGFVTFEKGTVEADCYTLESLRRFFHF